MRKIQIQSEGCWYSEHHLVQFSYLLISSPVAAWTWFQNFTLLPYCWQVLEEWVPNTDTFLWENSTHIESVLSSILCDSGLNSIRAQFSLNFRIIFSNISMERGWFVPSSPWFTLKNNCVFYLKNTEEFQVRKIIHSFYECVHKNVRMYFREYLCFHCFSSLMVYKKIIAVIPNFQTVVVWVFVFLFKTGCTECEKSKIAVRGWYKMH